MKTISTISPSAQYIRNNNFIEKLVYKKTFWLIFCSLAFLFPIWRSLNRELPADLPIYFQLPEYSLVNEEGKEFGSKALKGKVYIANFMFTSCPSTCPALMEKMQVIQKRVRGLGNRIALTTLTVDPEQDSPTVLFKYARRLHANPYVWNFLTGERGKLKKIIIDGFRVPMGNSTEEKKFLMANAQNNGVQTITMMDIVHSEKLVLVDYRGRIRGYYPTDTDGINRLMIDVGLLVNRKPN